MLLRQSKVRRIDTSLWHQSSRLSRYAFSIRFSLLFLTETPSFDLGQLPSSRSTFHPFPSFDLCRCRRRLAKRDSLLRHPTFSHWCWSIWKGSHGSRTCSKRVHIQTTWNIRQAGRSDQGRGENGGSQTKDYGKQYESWITE